MLKLISIFALLFLCSTVVYADGNGVEKPNQSTSDFVPGEEVVTPTGKKVKVWSTKGPVAVSKAPDPFTAPDKAKLPSDSHIIIDENTLGTKHDNKQPEIDN